MVDTLVYEAVVVFEELKVPTIVAVESERIEGQLRVSDEDGLPGRATKARVSVAARRRAKVEAGAGCRRIVLGNADRLNGDY